MTPQGGHRSMVDQGNDSAGGGGGFGNHVIIQQKNSVGAEVDTLALDNNFVSNTAGDEETDWLLTFLHAGLPVVNNLSAANLAARQAATTSGATPTVTLNPRVGLLVITLGANVSQLTINGLDLDTDFGYELCGQPLIGGGGTALDMQLNGLSGTYNSLLVFTHSSSAGASLGHFQVNDLLDVGIKGMFEARLRGVPGQEKTFVSSCYTVQLGVNYNEQVTGITSGITANITNIVLFGNMNAGSVITVSRMQQAAG